MAAYIWSDIDLYTTPYLICLCTVSYKFEFPMLSLYAWIFSFCYR